MKEGGEREMDRERKFMLYLDDFVFEKLWWVRGL
jgi:hypothetical protein